jgi:hypothetical protein
MGGGGEVTHKSYAVLYKGLEYAWVLVTIRCPGTNSPCIVRVDKVG